MEMLNIMFLVLLFLLIAWFWLMSRRSANFPPGPGISFPILGHLPLIGTRPYKTFLKWRSTYGPIVGIWLGNRRAIVISNGALIREAMSLNAFLGRPRLEFFRVWGGDFKGIGSSSGSHWLEQRKYAAKHLKDYGFCSKSIESRIQHEIFKVLERMKLNTGKSLVVTDFLELPVARVMWNSLITEDGKLGEDGGAERELEQVLHFISGIGAETSMAAGISMLLPWLSKLAPNVTGMAKFRKRVAYIRAFVQRRIQEHCQSHVPESPRDFVDAYMDKVLTTHDPISSFHNSHETVVNVVQDLLAGASETVCTTLAWIFAHMVKWPKIQEKLFHEIDGVVGSERFPSLNDRAQMPYTVALIHEVLRFSPIAPISVPRESTQDVAFQGFHIPKGTLLIANIYGAHYERAVWGDPKNFRPERFLDDSKSNVIKNENWLPFSYGKRGCIGETMAMDELFLFTTHIFQAFQVKPTGGLPSLEGVFGTSLAPAPFKILLKERKLLLSN